MASPTLLLLGQEETLTIAKFHMSVADSVDGLAYVPDVNGDLVVASATDNFAVYLVRRAKVGDVAEGVVLGTVQAKASGAIGCGKAATLDDNGKIKAAVVGTDNVIGYVYPVAAVNDGDMVTLVKTA